MLQNKKHPTLMGRAAGTHSRAQRTPTQPSPPPLPQIHTRTPRPPLTTFPAKKEAFFTAGGTRMPLTAHGTGDNDVHKTYARSLTCFERKQTQKKLDSDMKSCIYSYGDDVSRHVKTVPERHTGRVRHRNGSFEANKAHPSHSAL